MDQDQIIAQARTYRLWFWQNKTKVLVTIAIGFILGALCCGHAKAADPPAEGFLTVAGLYGDNPGAGLGGGVQFTKPGILLFGGVDFTRVDGQSGTVTYDPDAVDVDALKHPPMPIAYSTPDRNLKTWRLMVGIPIHKPKR